jgi:hypothetical protein
MSKRKIDSISTEKPIFVDNTTSSNDDDETRSKKRKTNLNEETFDCKLGGLRKQGVINMFLSDDPKYENNILVLHTTSFRNKYYKWEEIDLVYPTNSKVEFKLQKTTKESSGDKFFKVKERVFEDVGNDDYKVELNEDYPEKCIFKIEIDSFSYRKIFFKLIKNIYSGDKLFATSSFIFRKSFKNDKMECRKVKTFEFKGKKIK